MPNKIPIGVLKKLPNYINCTCILKNIVKEIDF